MFPFRVPVWFFWAALTCDVARLGLCGLQVDPKAKLMEILRVLFNFAQFTPFCFLADRGRLRESRSPNLLSELQRGLPLCPLPGADGLSALIAPLSSSILLPPPSPTFPFLHLPLFSVPLLPAPPPFTLSHLIQLCGLLSGGKEGTPSL